MPIKGLTDQAPSFPQIGTVRKGGPKGEKRPGKDLEYFRVQFDEEETEAAELFRSVYGDTPSEINILVPFDEIDRNWEAWRESYVKGAMTHRCDGEHVVYAIHAGTGALLVREGLSVETGEPVLCDGSANCKPCGRLRVIVPELRRLAYLMVLTTSIHDIVNISKQLKAIKEMNGGQLRGIPLVLRRRPKMISTPSGSNGKRARRVKWLISIEADPKWVQAVVKQLQVSSFPALPAPAEAATEIIEGEVVDVTTGEILEEEEGIDIPLNGNGDAEEEVPARWFDDLEIMRAAEKWLFKRGVTWGWALEALGVKKIADFPGTREAAKEAWEAALRDARPKKAKRKKQGALI